jgi:hypothetical protein
VPTHRGKPLPRTCKVFPGKLDGAGLLVREPLAHKVLRALAAVWSAAGVSPHDGVRQALFRSVLDHLRETAMLWTLFVVLMILWFLGVVSSYTLGGFIHLLLVIALIAVVLQLVQGRRVV